MHLKYMFDEFISKYLQKFDYSYIGDIKYLLDHRLKKKFSPN